ncbi:MAG: tRNA lysidine(34) synthetase TilS [Bacilli bacterium]|nr:tRNA lysidine(34) synthetase TilS [Bacilli bacterium]
MNKSIDFLNNNIMDNSSVVVAVSGGPDSMALLSLLLKIRDKKNINIIVAHVNHNLREESKEEYQFVKDYSEKNNCIFEGIDLNFDTSTSIEEAARKKRYDFFEEILNKYNSNILLTAHHGDDLIETILMRLTRGSSIDGYVGFKKISKRDNYTILRPLIYYTKEEIMNYLVENNIDYRIDKTNSSKKYTRNRYRLDILPVLKNENKNVNLKYLQFSEMLDENNTFVNKYVNNKYDEIVLDNIINIELLLKEDIYIVKKIAYKYLYNVYLDDIYLIESKHIDDIINMITSNKSYLEISLPNNVVLEKDYSKLSIKNYFDNEEYKIELKDEVRINNGVIKYIDETTETSNYVTHIDSSKVKLPLYVRNRRDGDYIEVLNLNGKKKVKDIFIDSKIDNKLRDSYPLVVDSDDNIIWIPGIKKSKYDGLKVGKYDIILKYIDGGKNE